MTLASKILLGAGATAVVATIAGIVTVHQLSSRNRINELHSQMRSVIEQSETMASNLDRMHRAGAFDYQHLLDEAKKAVGNRPLQEAYRETTYYPTIPIVAAWQSVEEAAKKNGFDFFVPSRPGVPARNAKNNNGAEFQQAFDAFAAGEKEYFRYDRSKGELVLARPVFVQGSCLNCHGDASTSVAGDGKDPLGFAMEGLKAGDLKGAFILKAPMTGDPVVRATVQIMALVGAGCLLVVLIGFYVFNRRTIIAPLSRLASTLKNGAHRVGDSSEQVSAASQSLAEGASEQAAALEETSASLEEMTSMVKRNADAAAKAKELAADARGAADSGADQMVQMQEAMSQIRASSDDVAHIVKSIDEIAFQTNILALNAAVEAARAGEAGAGFAVVADEVRNLAQRSAVAAKETAGKIEAAIDKIQRGVEISGLVSHGLQQIVGKVREMDQLAAEIATASNEQAQGLAQVNIAVSEMDKVTQANAATAEESASASQELHAQAKDLNTAVEHLEDLMGETEVGETARPASKPAPARAKGRAPAHPVVPRPTPAAPGPAPAKPAAPALSHPGRSSGAATAAPTSTRTPSRGVSEIPMDDDFKDF